MLTLPVLKVQQAKEMSENTHDNLASLRDEDLAMIAKAHATKMAAKWEKINQKEAKKAAKAQPRRQGVSVKAEAGSMKIFEAK